VSKGLYYSRLLSIELLLVNIPFIKGFIVAMIGAEGENPAYRRSTRSTVTFQ
jgi:hypothetical protein